MKDEIVITQKPLDHYSYLGMVVMPSPMVDEMKIAQMFKCQRNKFDAVTFNTGNSRMGMR